MTSLADLVAAKPDPSSGVPTSVDDWRLVVEMLLPRATGYVTFNGTADNYLSCADVQHVPAAGLSPLFMIVTARIHVDALASENTVVAKWGAAGNRSWWFGLNGDGDPMVKWSANGTDELTAVSSTPLDSDFTGWVRWFISVSFPASVNISTSSDGVEWTTLHTGALSTSSVFVGTAPVTIGADAEGDDPFEGHIWRVEVGGGRGTVLLVGELDPATEPDAASITAVTGQTVTAVRTADENLVFGGTHSRWQGLFSDGETKWGSATWTGHRWRDVTRYVRGMEWERGGSSPDDRMRAGQARITLSATEAFDPLDPDGTFGTSSIGAGTLLRAGLVRPPLGDPDVARSVEIHTVTPSPATLVDTLAEDFSITWAANPSIASWEDQLWVVFDGNNDGGTTEGASGQTIFLMTSSDGGATWSTPVEPFTDGDYADNPVTLSAAAFQPNLVAMGGELWCFWSGQDGFASRLTSPAGKWQNYRWEFDDDGVPSLSTTVSGGATGGRSLRLTLGAVADYFPFSACQPTVLADGVVAAPFTFYSSTEIDPNHDAAALSFWELMKANVILYTADNGATWTRSDPIPEGNDSYPAANWEPFISESPDGAIWVFSRNNRAPAASDEAQLVAVSTDRIEFTSTVITEADVPVSRGYVGKASAGRWLQAHDDWPNTDGGNGASMTRYNGALLASLRGVNDYVPGIPFSDLASWAIYPQFVVIGNEAHVVYTRPFRARYSLMYSKVAVPTDDTVAYIHPRRQHMLRPGGTSPGKLPDGLGWLFDGAERVDSSDSLAAGGDLTLTAWMTPVYQDNAMLIDGRTGNANSLLRGHGGGFATIIVNHGGTINSWVPAFVAAVYDASAGTITSYHCAGGGSFASTTAHIRSVTVDSNPSINEQITVDGTTFTFIAGTSGGTDVQIGAAASDTASNLAVQLQANGFTAGRLTASPGTTVYIARADRASFTVSGSANVTVDAEVPFRPFNTPVFGHRVTGSIPNLRGQLHEARVYGSALSEANLRSIYNGWASTFGYSALGSASAPGDPDIILDPSSTSSDFSNLIVPTAASTGTEGSDTTLILPRGASAGVEMPFEKTKLSVRWKFDGAPDPGETYVIATIGSRAHNVKIHISGDAATTLKAGSTTIGTVADVTGWNVLELSAYSGGFVVNGTSFTVNAPGGPRVFLGDAYPDGTPGGTITFNPAEMSVTVGQRDWLPQFTVRATDWQPAYEALMHERRVEVTGIELISQLAGIDENALTREIRTEPALNRIERLLDRAGWKYGLANASRDLRSSLMSSFYAQGPTNMSENRLAEVYVVADGCGQSIHSDRTGAVRVTSRGDSNPLATPSGVDPDEWRNLHPLYDFSYTEFQSLIGLAHTAGMGRGGHVVYGAYPDGGFRAYEDITTVFNDFIVGQRGSDSEEGGPQARLRNRASIGRWGRRSFARYDLFTATEEALEALAAKLKLDLSNTALVMDDITVWLSEDRPEEFLAFCAVDLLDRVEVIPPGTDIPATDTNPDTPYWRGWVTKLVHRVTPKSNRSFFWTVEIGVNVSFVRNLPGMYQIDS